MKRFIKYFMIVVPLLPIAVLIVSQLFNLKSILADTGLLYFFMVLAILSIACLVLYSRMSSQTQEWKRVAK